MNKIYFQSSFNFNNQKVRWNEVVSIQVKTVTSPQGGGVYLELTLKNKIKFLTDKVQIKLVNYWLFGKGTQRKVLNFMYELKKYYSHRPSVAQISFDDLEHLEKQLSRFIKQRNLFLVLIVCAFLYILIHKLTMSSLASFEDYGRKHDVNTSNMSYSSGNLCSGHVRLTRKVDENLIYERYCGFMNQWYRYYQDVVKIPKADIRKDEIKILNNEIVMINNMEYQAQPLKAKVNWHEAEQSCNTLDLYGKGWRLPTLNELERISNIYLCDQLFEHPCSISRNRWLDLNDEYRVKTIDNGIGVFIKKELPHLHENFLHRFWTSEYAQSNWSIPSHRDNPENVMYVVDFFLAQVKTANKHENRFNAVICVRDDLKQGLSNEN